MKVHGQQVQLRAEVASPGALSGHADSDALMAWLRTLPGPPAHTFITHGEPAASDSLRRRIKDRLGWACRVPEDREVVSLDPAGVTAKAGL